VAHGAGALGECAPAAVERPDVLLADGDHELTRVAAQEQDGAARRRRRPGMTAATTRSPTRARAAARSASSLRTIAARARRVGERRARAIGDRVAAGRERGWGLLLDIEAEIRSVDREVDVGRIGW
jgi:hypothetical protein